MAHTVKCDVHADCFANKGGKCVSLKDNDFGGRGCPFYKSNKEANMDDIAAECKAYAAMHGPDSGEEGDGA